METLNPDSTILQQLEGEWQKIVLLLLWKLVKDAPVKISIDDMIALQAAFPNSMPTLLAHGHSDSFELRVISMEQAKRLAEYDANQMGTA